VSAPPDHSVEVFRGGGEKHLSRLKGVSSSGESVSFDSGLQLERGLITPLEVALLEAPVNTDGQVVRDARGDFDDQLEADISESGIDDIRGETEESLSGLVNSGVLIVESGDESDRFTAEVELVMDRTLGENCSLTPGEGVDDKASPVLFDEPGIHLTINEEQELGRSRVGVGGVHSARCHLADSHSHTVRKESREVGDIGDGEVSASVADGTNSSIIIEQPISVVCEDVETSHLSRCPLQIGHDIGGLGSISGLSDSLESGPEDEWDESDELHDG